MAQTSSHQHTGTAQAAAPACAWDAASSTLRVTGNWTLRQLHETRNKKVLRQAKQACKQAKADAQMRLDVRAVQTIDHLGAQWLWQHAFQGTEKSAEQGSNDSWRARLITESTEKKDNASDTDDAHSIASAPDASHVVASMLQRVADFSAPVQRPARNHLLQPVMVLGEAAFVFLDHLRGMLRLLGQLVLDVFKLLRAPAKGPWRDISSHIYQMGTTAMPITALVGFLIGVVLTYLMALQLQQFGADSFVVNILGLALTRELGPMLAAILIAGRSGSAITAQIGVMRVNEELDAMQVMGIAHGYRLVMPRALALFFAMPLLSTWTTIAALTGGILVSQLVLNISASYFLQSLPDVLAVSNFYIALAKSAVFGLCIGLVGCHFGLRIKPNTQSLGEGTTASVVAAITMVILIDAVFAIVFKSFGV